MIMNAIYKIVNGQDLDLNTTKAVMEQIMNGEATNAQIGSFLTAMRMKGESIEEITACAMVMREKCTKLKTGMDVLDIVGTGGDEANTFNISTISALVVSAAGVPVAKHGNRSVSSKCGSADLLEALGVKIDINAEKSEQILRKIGLCFMFAPTYHASMKYAAPVRRELAVRTIFNILGPLANPAGANTQLLGVYDENLVEPLARVLSNLGVRRAMVVHGHDGLDEVTLCSTTTVCEVFEGKLNSFFLDPEQLGFKKCTPEELVGGNPDENARIALDILNGEKGPKRDIVLLNTAVCLYMFHSHTTLRDCVRLAGEIIDSGKAKAQLERFIALSNEVEL
ncbi:anthranilate phosphoribosyltransferase [Desulfosporosinus nitroreducens]|uniref:Anthranilate phosphoribosyltransferase n=1 Tax=Desulfosporosinus nitroreducens TaxID=2018668 RepID=A0ABT8QN13_9FIRM|nr:anthranilate phosphoribosyltransferase [Desulfosporosinus nitroreducens]MCO1603323.1 anthranilate phosphoribosyltransferase [Desulfosporosinus nitroreducens]MDO0822728.1 anthranilate phosphoribosyltransferase [Desulfosporosinus nitroreducens]